MPPGPEIEPRFLSERGTRAGCRVRALDNAEVGRHPTGPASKSGPARFLIDYAIGGISGWKTDLTRYDNESDMWVDYVRVYCAGKQRVKIHWTHGITGGIIRAQADTAL